MRRERLHEICGESLDIGNVEDVAKRLREKLKAADVLGVDLKDLVELDKAPVRGSRNKRGGTGGGGAYRQRNPQLDNVVGLVGEYHAFLHLQKKYGKRRVTARSWKSGYSLQFFPGNEVDDELGYDFEILIQGVRTFIEVKSTTGDDRTFDLGASEVRYAAEVAQSPINGRYLILRVKRSLLATPDFEVLPNPFEPKYRDRYVFSRNSFQISYTVV